MATLREYLTPAEQERFRKLHAQGYFDPITLNRFTQRMRQEFEYIDMLQRQLDRATSDIGRVRGSTAQDVETRSRLQYTIDYTKDRIPRLRAGAFDSALSGDLSGRTRRAIQDFERATHVREDGQLTSAGDAFAAIPWIGDSAEKNLMARDLENQIREQGIVDYTINLAGSMITSPIRGAHQLTTGGLGENPLEAIAEIGSVLPIGRAFGRFARPGSLTSKAVRSPLWTVPSYTAQVSDIVGAGEGAYSELLAEGAIEAIGSGRDLVRHIRQRRAFPGVDPQQEIESRQATESTTEHDRTTGSRTAPGTQGLSPETARAVERARADSAVESAEAQAALDAAKEERRTSMDQELRRAAWERMLIEAEEREAAEAEQAAREQRFIDQDDAYTAQQQAEAEAAAEQQTAEADRIEHTKNWLPFYSDMAGGSQSEGIRLLNQEYEAGVRDPIAHRYDQIASGLREQMGAAPSELHREADKRLRQQIGEKWYNIHRGIDQRPTPQERAARAEEAAEKIVEGTDEGTDGDTDTGTTATGTQQTDRETQQGSGEAQPDETDVDNVPATDIPDPRDSVPPSRIGTENRGYESDGTTGHNVRPVLRELDDLVPSHQLDGEAREDYPQDLQPRGGRGGAISMEQVRNTARNPNFAFLLEFFKQFRDGAPVTSKKHPRRVVSGNGRTLALQFMQQNYPENWEAYQAALREELARVGIDPAEADAMEAPVLTYELMDDIDEVALAKDANTQATLDHTAAEQAGQDAQYFDNDLMALWEPGEGSFEEVLKSEGNQAFRTALFRRIPTQLVSAFMTADNRNFSDDGIKRIQNAMIRYVFGEDIGDQLANVLIEQGLEDVKNVETMLRHAIASLAYAKANGQDISTQLASAIFRFIEFNKTAEREARERKQPKDVMLYASIEAFYKSGTLIDAPTLLEKQLLYLVYAKRNAPRQLADDFQVWAQNVVARGQADAASLFDTAISEAIFAGMIRDYIRETILETQQTQDGQTVLVPPESMPPELVSLRREMDKMSGTADKDRFANDWIDAFLRMMNEGEEQSETQVEADVGGTDAGATGTPRGTGEDTDEGVPDPGRDTGAAATPESEGGVAPTQPQGTDGDDTGAAEGAADDVPVDDRGSDLSVSRDSLSALFGGRVWITDAIVDRINDVLQQKGDQTDRTDIRTVKWENDNGERVGFSDAQINLLMYSLATGQTPNQMPDGFSSRLSGSALETIADFRRIADETDTVDADQDVSTEEGGVDAANVPPTETPVDANQVVGVSRRIETSETTVSPVIANALQMLGVSAEEWERQKAEGTAEEFLNTLPQDEDYQIDAVIDLAGDIAGEMDYDDIADEDLDLDDEDFFSDVDDGILRDITDQQRSDFETVRKKLFLSKTIARLEAKGTDRTPIETARLRALQAPQRTDQQQSIYEEMLTAFIDQRVAYLQSKPQRNTTENRILEALVAVQADGLPEEASDLSLYSDLETPDQEHSRPLAETRTLAGVQAPDTADTELDLPEDVTADKNKLSPAQQSSVKAIIAAFLRKIHTDTDTTVQGGFLLGDKPGVGKTRQALAAMWHYIRQGINKHFVLAPNQQILDNYSKDMQAMGGPASDISHYDSGNKKLKTPIGTATYSMITRKPDLVNFATAGGSQNAIADIVEHLTGTRPTLQQTHPAAYQALREAYARIFPNLQDGASVADVVAELQRQAGTVNRENAAHVQNFRQRVTPMLADLLLAEDGQQELIAAGAEGSELYTRVEQLLNFAETHFAAQTDPNFRSTTEAFEGVIVLDEMHKTAGTNSQIGQTIAKLHELLPNAKFLYMSATPFKEIDNFWVAERLGLWGANQPFPSFDRFRRTFRRASRAVKEVIPLHLKQIGRYISRALSSKETRYTPVEVPLTDTEKRQYDTAVQLVQGIRQRFDAAIDAALRTAWGSIIESEGMDGQYRAKYMRMYYGAMQVFYLAVLDAMKAQGLEADIKEKLQNGDKVIVQLENTWEKSIARAKERKKGGTIGPFDLLVDFVENENTFPIHEHTTEVRTRSDGSHYTVVIPRMRYDAEGNQVRSVDPNLKRLQTQLIAALRQEMQRSVFTAGLPFAADIIHEIAISAGVASGEISGRTETFSRNNPQRMPQDPASRIGRAKAFSETTDLNLIVLGPAGLTGINLPVSEAIKDKVGGLFHYLVQSSWNVNTFEQGLGRGKRSNSAIDPQYQVVYQDLPGADRVLGATLAKFAEMGALAGQADNALMQNIDKVEGETNLDDDPEADVPDVFDETQDTGERSHVFGVHGQEALAQLWRDMHEAGDMEIADTLGLVRPELAGNTGLIDPDTIPSVQQFFQRLLHQSTTEQPRIYEQFESRLKRIIAYRRELGELDVGANDLNSKDGQVTDRLTIYTDPDTGQTAEMVKLSVKRKLPRRSWEFAQKVIRGEEGYEHHGRNFIGIYQDADGHVWAVFEAPFRQGSGTEYIRWGPRGTPIQGIHQGENRITAEELANDFTHISVPSQPQITDVDAAKQLWEAEDADADTYVDSELFMATGLILPKWSNLSTQRMHALMAVIPMLDGSNLHGRVIPSGRVSEVLEQIGGVDPNHFDADRTETTTPDTDTETSPNGDGNTFAEIDIPQFVRDIIGQQTDTRIAERLETIVEAIHKGMPMLLRGHRVRDAAEAALLGQLIRDPQVEHTWIVYRKDGRIVKIEPMSLNRKTETKAGDFTHIKRTAAKEKADSVLRIHNHPSGVAKWSDTDKRVAMQWHTELGTLMAEDIIVDSGTYAYRTFENGEYTWHQDVVLDATAAGFDTSPAAVPDATGEVKPTDPLYQNPLIRGAREAATYMLGLKHRTDVAELIFVDPKTGRVTDTVTDTLLRTSRVDAEIVQRLKDLIAQRPGQHVHVVMWGGNPAYTTAKVLMKANIDGMDSVWVDSTRGQGIDSISTSDQGDASDTTTDTDTEPDTITIKIGDEDHTLIRSPDDDTDTDTDTLSDVITDLITDLKKWWDRLTKKEKADIRKKRKFTKPVIIAGVHKHELYPDKERRLQNRYDRGIDAEHMVRGDEKENLRSILGSGTLKKAGTYPGVEGSGPRVFFSYGPYYRRNESRHDYGVILDLEKMLREIPGMYGTIHTRNNWGTRRAITSVKEMRKLVNSNQIGHPDTVIEISFPQDIDISKYFVGIVEDGKVYAKKEYLVESQLTREQIPAEFPTTKSESELKQDIRAYKAKIKELIAEIKPRFDRAIQEEKDRIQRLDKSIDRRDIEINKLYSNLHFNRTKTPHSDRSRIKTLKSMLSREIDQRRDAQKRLEELRKWEGTIFFAKPHAAYILKEIQQELKQASRQLKEKQNPRRKRQGVLMSDVTTDGDNILSDYTAQVQRTNPDSVVYRVHAPEDLAMTGRGRAKSAEIGEKALNTFLDSNAGIMGVLKAWSPTARRWARLTKNEFVSGFGRLTDLEAPQGSDAPSPADVLKEILRERQMISKLNAGRALSALEPPLLAFNKLARKRTRLRTTAAAPGTRKATRTAMSHKVWNFIEYNTPIENDPELLEAAENLKEAWRELLIYDTEKIVELMGELETINEKLYVTDSAGKRVEWYGESFDGFEWDPETKGYTKDGKAYTIEEAHRAANKLYMPHYFRGKSPLQQYAALSKMQDDLNKLLASDDPAAQKELLQRFEIEIDPGGFQYTHLPTGKTASTAYEMVRIVADHLSNEDAALQGIMNYYQDEGRVGYYGHLERTRETDDRFYARDVALLAENRIRLWDRLAEVATIGQQHPLIGDSPRMKTLIEQVMTFDKTPREAALRKFIDPLKPGDEGMFERLPQFASGVDTALDIMQHWLERDADGQKTGNYQEIDIGRMNLDDATLTELERIGLIEKDGDSWKVVGEDIAQRHATLARHIHEFYNTLAQRKNAVHSLVLGLGNWHTRDPLEMESSEFWKKINDAITVLTLNHGVAIQNMLEIPLISMMTGANPLFKGLKNMANKEYRDAMQQLARGLSHARKFMADTSLADKYLGSPLTFFSKSDEFSRAAGLGIGLENAKAKIQRYAEAEGKRRDAIGREMDAIRLNKEVIAGIPVDQLSDVLTAAEELILNNEVDTVFSSEKGGELSAAERLAGTMLRSMFYVSDETFKQYDASSLPAFMVSRNPLIRVFMKYKSWMLQQNRLVYNQLKRAYREAKQGNPEPLGNFIASSAMMGLGTGGLLWLYSGLQGDDDDKTVTERLMKGLAAAQTFGIGSVMFELAMYAEGNWYQMSNLLAKQAAGPTFSVAAQMIGPVFTGDFGQAGEEALRRLPIVSFSRRVGGWRLLEEATGIGEDNEE